MTTRYPSQLELFPDEVRPLYDDQADEEGEDLPTVRCPRCLCDVGSLYGNECGACAFERGY